MLATLIGPVEKVRGHGPGFRRILGPESTVSRFVFYTNNNNKTFTLTKFYLITIAIFRHAVSQNANRGVPNKLVKLQKILG